MLKEFVATEEGAAISELSVVATPEDSEYLGFDEINLNTAPDVSELVSTLEEVIRELEQS